MQQRVEVTVELLVPKQMSILRSRVLGEIYMEEAMAEEINKRHKVIGVFQRKVLECEVDSEVLDLCRQLQIVRQQLIVEIGERPSEQPLRFTEFLDLLDRQLPFEVVEVEALGGL